VGRVDNTPGPEPHDSGDDPGEGADDRSAPPAGDEVTTDDVDDRGIGDPGAADDDGTEYDGDEDDGSGDPLRFNNWMKRSATGAVLSGIAFGLQQALEPKRELPAFVMEAPGEPEDPDAPITLHFDPDDPTKTVAVIRTPPPLPPDPPDGRSAS
jgi:hypothetical protein